MGALTASIAMHTLPKARLITTNGAASTDTYISDWLVLYELQTRSWMERHRAPGIPTDGPLKRMGAG